MKKKDLEYFRNKLLQYKMAILNGSYFKSNEDLIVSRDDLADEADLATSVINQQVSFSIRNKEREKLRSIEDALASIERGDYGICIDCDEEIEFKRLDNQPWTNLCILHAEEREREMDRIAKKA